MLRTLLSCVSLALVTACSSVPPVNVDAIKRDVKTVTFVQNGKQPAEVKIGMVDGKTFWAKQSGVVQPSNADSRADQQAAVAGVVVPVMASAIARAAIANNPEQYDRVLEQVKLKRELGLEAGRSVLPVLAAAWQVPFDATQLVVLPEAIALTDETNRYRGADPGSDLVLAFSLNQLTITEKVSLGSAFAAATKLGMGSRNVMTQFNGELAAYRRTPANVLERVWSTRCQSTPLEGPSDDWEALSAEPARMKPMLDGSIPFFVAACRKAIQANLTAQ